MFVVCAVGALANPLLGILGYIAHYNIGPEGQWWFSSLRGLDLRYSFTLAAATTLGVALNWNKLSWGNRFFLSQEKLMLAFLGLVWLLSFICESGVTYTVMDHPAVKLTKILLFALLMTHVVTTLRALDAVLWVLVAGGLLLGLEAYETPYSAFASGRLENVGGPDFCEANALAAYLATLLPLVGVQFLRSKWRGKLFCMAAGAFILNGVVLTRSRGAVVGLACGAVVAAVCSPRQHRLKIIVCVALGGAALLYLGDQAFWTRTNTITADTHDRSAESRPEIWEGGLRMALDHPYGVGPGNFQYNIGRYAIMHPNRDAHSTIVRTLGELGFPGLAIFAALVVNAAWMLIKSGSRISGLAADGFTESQYLSFGLLVSMSVFLAAGLTGSFTYIEALWWLLALPVCLHRALDNACDRFDYGGELALVGSDQDASFAIWT
jgi:O-antigen ligase